MTPQEYNELMDRVEEFRRRHGHRFVTRYRRLESPSVSGFTLLWWIAVGCAVGAMIVLVLVATGLLRIQP